MNWKSRLLVSLAVSLVVMGFVAVAPAFAGGTEPFSAFINNIITMVQGIAALVAVLFVVIGALKLKAAQGNPVAQQNAKATIFLAVAGLLVVIFARDIVSVIVQAAG